MKYHEKSPFIFAISVTIELKLVEFWACCAVEYYTANEIFTGQTELRSIFPKLPTLPCTHLQTEPLATHALCFMIGDLKSSLQAMVAIYGSHCMTAERLLNSFWDVAANL